jgi:hypothetical protein
VAMQFHLVWLCPSIRRRSPRELLARAYPIGSDLPYQGRRRRGSNRPRGLTAAQRQAKKRRRERRDAWVSNRSRRPRNNRRPQQPQVDPVVQRARAEAQAVSEFAKASAQEKHLAELVAQWDTWAQQQPELVRNVLWQNLITALKRATLPRLRK